MAERGALDLASKVRMLQKRTKIWTGHLYTAALLILRCYALRIHTAPDLSQHLGAARGPVKLAEHAGLQQGAKAQKRGW